MPALILENITVQADRIVVRVIVPDPLARRTTPSLAAAACEARPNLGGHVCKNSRGPHFSDCIADTPTPHLLEHLIVDFMAQYARDPERLLIGYTQWDDEPKGRARVVVSYESDLAAFKAIQQAVDLLNEIYQ